ESPSEGASYVSREFGIEVPPQHFSRDQGPAEEAAGEGERRASDEARTEARAGPRPGRRGRSRPSAEAAPGRRRGPASGARGDETAGRHPGQGAGAPHRRPARVTRP